MFIQTHSKIVEFNAEVTMKHFINTSYRNGYQIKGFYLFNSKAQISISNFLAVNVVLYFLPRFTLYENNKNACYIAELIFRTI